MASVSVHAAIWYRIGPTAWTPKWREDSRGGGASNASGFFVARRRISRRASWDM